MRATVWATALLLAAVTACGTEEPPPGGQPAPPPAVDSPDEDLAELPGVPVDQAVTQAGADFDVPPEQIEVVTAEQVTWADGAMGCPEPDGMYTQALVEGYRVILELDGREVHYHGARDEPPFHCEDPQEPAETDS